ncbi:MAG: amino acid permease [Bacteroidia bacterium]|nr:amino acid permease [Bacteroidia bacterium]MCZ2276665.1 amino acid permease [Bacteroidia bacterium]
MLKSLFRKKSIPDILEQVDLPHDDIERPQLARNLNVWDLTAFGIAAIVGAGIFSTIGSASADGGPGVILLFIFTATACSFAAFAYAEFASRIPVSGSAYTYSYVAFGEILAWIIGWALIMEYAVGNATVCVSWSDYFTGLLASLKIEPLGIQGIIIPAWAEIDYVSAQTYYNEAALAMQQGSTLQDLPVHLQTGFLAWEQAPSLLGLRLIADWPALFINIVITYLVFRGIKESKRAANTMVILKLIVIFAVIVVGAFYIDTTNWSPFLPNGIGGVLKGVSAVFFAYIGFDAISTTAEECKNPERDLPRGILNAIVICTILYILIALVLTGLVSYSYLRVGDPLAFVFGKLNMHFFSGIIAIGAVIAITGVILVFQIGQPRIWMSMSRDGLLPKKFASIHPKYKTPSFATFMTGVICGLPILFIPSETVLDLCSMGTLFAFVLVCGGILRLQNDTSSQQGKFKTPYLNGKYILPLLFIVSATLSIIYAKEWTSGLLKFENWDQFRHLIPMWLFIFLFAGISVRAFLKNYSVIPALGMIFCFYMMAQIEWKSWIGFLIWLAAGLIIYFGFSYKHSKLNHPKKA